MHLHNFCSLFRLPLPELQMRACLRGRRRVKGRKESDWMGGGGNTASGGWGRGVDLCFCLSAARVENV